MLNKEQLQAIAYCSKLVGCEDCPKKHELIDTECADEAAKTALELMEENEKLKLMLKKCDPISMSTLRCMFCDKFYLWGHTEDCEYMKAVENV